MTISNDLTVELTDIEKVIPYEKNAKKHSEAQIEVLAGLIRKNGWTQPIVVDGDGEVIAGHGRRLAAIKLGLKKVPVVWRRDLSKAEANALRLSDNRVASTDYDTSLLQEELMALDEAGIAVEELGFTEQELEFLTGDLTEMDESVFVNDVSEAVETQKEENKSKTDEIDKSQAPIGDCLGFKRVSVEQSRKIREFMTAVEQQTGLKGVDAFMSHVEGY
jgi:hypothetical protein